MSGPGTSAEKILSYASPLLLYGEEIDPRSGRHLGNFPQAFTHLALINAVMHVIRKGAGRAAAGHGPRGTGRRGIAHRLPSRAPGGSGASGAGRSNRVPT